MHQPQLFIIPLVEHGTCGIWHQKGPAILLLALPYLMQPPLHGNLHTLRNNIITVCLKEKFLLELQIHHGMWNRCRLSEVINGQLHEQTLADKINVFTNIHKLDTAAMCKQVSTRGNTKPRWLIELIQCKRRLQNGLCLLASDTRIRTENAYIQLLQLDSLLQDIHYPKYQYNLRIFIV